MRGMLDVWGCCDLWISSITHIHVVSICTSAHADGGDAQAGFGGVAQWERGNRGRGEEDGQSEKEESEEEDSHRGYNTAVVRR